MFGDVKRRPGGGGAAVNLGKQINADNSVKIAGKQQAFICGAPDVAGLFLPCDVELTLDRLADKRAEQTERIAAAEGPRVERLPVRTHLLPQPSCLRCSRPELEAALIWTRLPEPDPARLGVGCERQRARTVRRGVGSGGQRVINAKTLPSSDWCKPDEIVFLRPEPCRQCPGRSLVGDTLDHNGDFHGSSTQTLGPGRKPNRCGEKRHGCTPEEVFGWRAGG